MFHDEDSIASQRARQGIIPGEDLSALSLDDLAERRATLEAEIRRIEDITEKKKTGLSEADAVFKL
ncbi:DUF1192 domain-containing protein [Maricaulis maris]|jgi:uncharacterized small protein (DUF1192 family)|uniref:DUF1192 domain-containing protein n=1 Tax=Maricaulis maris TaxID=74318 RepID=UPI002922941F|nr:hypothetical protein MACH15_25560 [Maricaulis maris]